MKRVFKFICLTSIILGFTSCHKEDTMEQVVEHGNDIVVNTSKIWETSELPAYIGDISYLPKELQGIIRQRFPESASIERANIIFVGASELSTNYEILQTAAAAGKFVVIPGNADYTVLGVDADPIISPSDSDDIDPLFYCYTFWGEDHLYVMYSESAPEQIEDGTPSLTDEEWYELNNEGIDDEDLEEDFHSPTDYDNQAQHNENYYQSRIDPFVNWVDNSFLERSLILTRAGSYDNLKVNIEQSGMRLTYNYPFSLNKFIDKATLSKPDYLCKSGSITVEFRIYPIYMHSGNGEKAGDYYGVVSTITPHNESMWGPYCATHGKTKLRIYGYWFDQMYVETSLTHLDGSPINGLNYYERPIPENANDSKSYSNGKTYSWTGAISGGCSGGKPYVVAQVGMGVSCTSSINYTLETINYSLDSSTPNVKYHYSTNAVDLRDDWGDWQRIHRNFPAPVRTEFSAHSMWVWHVPGDVAQDNSTTSFKLNTNIKLVYSTWRHWRGTLYFNSNKKEYDVIVPEQSWELGYPDRTPWGFIKLRNATDKEMAHVKFYDAKKEGSEPIETLLSSYGKGEEVKIAFPEGTYNITWDIVDGNTGEKVSSWIYRNVKVVKGKDEISATTQISSVDAEQVK